MPTAIVSNPTTLTEYREALASANRQIENVKRQSRNMRSKFVEKNEDKAEKLILGTATIAGGALVGIMRGMDSGNFPTTELPYTVAVSTTLVLIGMFDGAGRFSDQFGAAGGGMAAALTAPYVENMVRAER